MFQMLTLSQMLPIKKVIQTQETDADEKRCRSVRVGVGVGVSVQGNH